MEDPIELRKSFERAGLAAIRVQQEANRASGAQMQDREIEARKWLAELDEADALAAAVKRDAREEETLSIARRAASLAEAAEARAERAEKISERSSRSAKIWSAIAVALSIAASIAASFIERGSLFPDRQPQPTVQPDSPASGGPAG